MQKPTRARMWCLALLIVYVASYVALSRRGYAEADGWEVERFYYLQPRDSIAWRLTNYGCVAFYGPLNLIDRALGLGRAPAPEPMFHLGS